MLSDAALLLAVALLVPLMVLIAWYDTRELRIPNWTVLAVFAVFLATGSWGLPVETFLWRIGYAVATLLVGFLVYALAGKRIGAGDLKLLAALAPFLSGATLSEFLLIYVFVSFAGLVVFFIARKIVGRRKIGWKALEQAVYFPAGVLLGVSMTVALLGEAAARFA